jgi:5-methylcytosine-specific restriction endonuclease McrA
MDSLIPHVNNGNSSEKKCTGPCGRILPATSEYFNRDKQKKDGLRPMCKECRSKEGAEYRAKPEVKERIQEYFNRPDVKAHAKAHHKEYRNRPEVKAQIKQQRKEYGERPEVKAHLEEYLSRPEVKERRQKWSKEYDSRSDVRERRNERRSRPEVKAKHKEYYSRSDIKEHRHRRYKELYSIPEVRERVLEYHKERYRIPEIKERQNVYQKEHNAIPEVKFRIRERHRANERNRRARKRNASGSHTRQDIQLQYDRQKGKCYYCHKKLKFGDHHVDHVVPLSRGGSNDISNLVIACSYCNCSKNNKLLHEWTQGGRLL